MSDAEKDLGGVWISYRTLRRIHDQFDTVELVDGPGPNPRQWVSAAERLYEALSFALEESSQHGNVEIRTVHDPRTHEWVKDALAPLEKPAETSDNGGMLVSMDSFDEQQQEILMSASPGEVLAFLKSERLDYQSINN